MKYLFQGLLLLGICSCMNGSSSTLQSTKANDSFKNISNYGSPPPVKHFKGPLTGGLKGDSIFFDVSANGKKIENLTFKGYWRCNGKLEVLPAAGPDGSFEIINGRVKGHISDPPDGGSTAWRFDLDATIKGNTATGTFRMNINNLGCNTYLLNFKAVAK